MTKKPIPLNTAKGELSRLNDILGLPCLLIGGLAVQQYNVARKSKDIDLILDFDIVQTILSDLYPTKDWNIEVRTNDEYRPSYRITHKVKVSELGEIIFGPKIAERGPYKYLNWEQLLDGARPFRYKETCLPNILVPTPHALAYSKFTSFLERLINEPKAKQDLNDFVNLTNNDEFLVTKFYDLLRSNDEHDELMEQFREIVTTKYESIISQSCLQSLSSLFPASSTPSSKGISYLLFREDLANGRYGLQWKQLVDRCQKSMRIWGWSCRNVKDGKSRDYFRKLVLENNRKLEFLVLDASAVAQAASLNFGPVCNTTHSAVLNDFNTGKDEIEDFVKDEIVPTCTPGEYKCLRVIMKATNWVMSWSGVAVDMDESNGLIQVELYLYNHELAERPQLILGPTDGGYYPKFKASLEQMWGAATPIELPVCQACEEERKRLQEGTETPTISS